LTETDQLRDVGGARSSRRLATARCAGQAKKPGMLRMLYVDKIKIMLVLFDNLRLLDRLIYTTVLALAQMEINLVLSTCAVTHRVKEERFNYIQ